MCPKIGGLDAKTEQSRLKMPTMAKKKKKHCICWKTKNTSRFYVVKISVSTNFMSLR